MNRTVGLMLFWILILAQISGCLGGPVSSDLTIRGINNDMDKTNVLSYRILFDQASFELPNHMVRISPFKLGFDPFIGKKGLFLRIRQLRAEEGAIRLVEIYEGDELIFLVADEARRDFLFLGGHSLNPGKVIGKKNNLKNIAWMELEVTTPQQIKISAKPKLPLPLEANGEAWKLVLVGASGIDPDIFGSQSQSDGFSADFMAYKVSAVKRK
jgi:hypothetical protein